MESPKKAPPPWRGIRSTTLQALPTNHKQYEKWKKAAAEHNTNHPAFKFDFEKKWAEAREVSDFIRVLKTAADRAETAANAASSVSLANAQPSQLIALPRKTSDPPLPVSSSSSRQPPSGNRGNSNSNSNGDDKSREEQALLSAMFSGPSLPATALQVQPVVDPFAGLSPQVRTWAAGIANWNQASGMAGVTGATMTRQQQEELTAWVLAQTTNGGNQKFVVIIGQGSGAYSGYVQFKVIGWAHRADGTAITYHISLSNMSYRPPSLPARFGF